MPHSLQTLLQILLALEPTTLKSPTYNLLMPRTLLTLQQTWLELLEILPALEPTLWTFKPTLWTFKPTLTTFIPTMMIFKLWKRWDLDLFGLTLLGMYISLTFHIKVYRDPEKLKYANFVTSALLHFKKLRKSLCRGLLTANGKCHFA